MPLSARLALAVSASMLCASLWAAPLDPKGVRAELAAITALAETSAPEAVRRLEALQARLGPDAPYALRRELLRAEVWMREDAGQMEGAYAAERSALQLALANKDAAGASLARLGEVRRLLDQTRPAAAQTELNLVLKDVPPAAPVDLKVALETVQGEIYNMHAQYDKALACYLRASKLLQDETGKEESAASLYSRIAQIYINSDNPAKAVETTRAGLALRGVSVRSTGTLQFTQAIALLRIDRSDEAIAAFRRALDTAVKGGLVGLEAGIRGNIADYYLRQHDYRAAERESRLALQASNRVNDQQLILMARANLGFALMGQGRHAEGLVHVDGVIGDMRRGEAWADMDAMFDEKSRMQERAALYKEALATVRAQQKLQQNSARIARDRAIASLQEEYDANQRTRQIEFLNRENRSKEAELGSRRIAQLATSVAAVLTVLAGAVVFVLYRRAKRSAKRLQQLNTQLEFHSMRDALTGLYNRRSFLEKMDARATLAEGERRKASADEVDCFVLMDIDHFKHINDRWGHGVGDSVLVEVAKRLTLAVRDTDMVLRWGGEEFLIYAPGTNPAYIAELVGRVLLAIGSAPVDAGSCSVPVTLTAGVVSLPAAVQQGGPDWQRAIRLADWALYQGKANGRNQAQIVASMAAPMDAVLATIDEAGHGALPQGLVELVSVSGPLR